jgi:hypothetical protein
MSTCNILSRKPEEDPLTYCKSGAEWKSFFNQQDGLLLTVLDCSNTAAAAAAAAMIIGRGGMYVRVT